jgi:hypothetical protein
LPVKDEWCTGRGIPRLTAMVLQVGVIFESNNFLLSFVITTAAAQEVGRSVARCPSIVLCAHRAMESLSMENDVTSPVTSYIGVLMSSELCTHVNARLLPRRWFLQLHWVPGRAHTDAQCINICTKTNSTQIHGDGNDGNVSGFGDGREPPPECPPELP